MTGVKLTDDDPGSPRLSVKQKHALHERIIGDSSLSFREKQRLLKAIGTEVQYAQHEMVVTITAPAGIKIPPGAAMKDFHFAVKRALFGFGTAPAGVVIKVTQPKVTGARVPAPAAKKAARKVPKKRVTKKRKATRLTWS